MKAARWMAIPFVSFGAAAVELFARQGQDAKLLNRRHAA
jgi:hypothetical protein